MTRGRTRRIASLSALVGLGVAALTGGAAADPRHLCAATAGIVSAGRGVLITDFSQAHPNGVPLHATQLVAHHFYDVEHGKLELRYGSNVYRVGPAESVIALGCYGQSRSQPADLPALRMLEGAVRVGVSQTAPGAVLTDEGLYGPIPGGTIPRRYTFSVTRKLQHNPNVTQALMWFAGLAGAPTGVAVVRTRSSSLVNVTPYVGPHPGVCVHVRTAWLRSTGWHRAQGGYLPSGTVKYDPPQGG
jgi:hypothetical protein